MIPKNKYLMTKNERIVYEKLKNCLSNQYVIFPQISIRSLIKNNYRVSDDVQWKIVDFVVCEKPYYEPVLAIEVNDHTHERRDRKERDSKVTVFLEKMDIPIWFLKPEQDYERFDNLNLTTHIGMMAKKYLKYERKPIGFNINN